MGQVHAPCSDGCVYTYTFSRHVVYSYVQSTRSFAHTRLGALLLAFQCWFAFRLHTFVCVCVHMIARIENLHLTFNELVAAAHTWALDCYACRCNSLSLSPLASSSKFCTRVQTHIIMSVCISVRHIELKRVHLCNLSRNKSK